MSYIDCYDHSVIGEVFGLPLYQAKQDITGEDFQCKKDQFIVGGGGGEFPAIVITDISRCVEILAVFPDDSEYEFDFEPTHFMLNTTFFHFSIMETVRLYNYLVEDGYVQSEDVHSPEIWLNVRVAELVYKEAKEYLEPSALNYMNIRGK